MSDIPKYLPLSQRPRRDESGVTGDWAPRLSAVLEVLAGLVEKDETASDDVARLIWMLRADRRSRLSAAIARKTPRALTDDPAAALRSIASETGRKRPLRDLASAVIVTLDVASASQRAVHLDAVSLGAVAVARALSAPLPIRAVLADVTLVASDGDWAVGRGPERSVPGAAIVLFLYGRTGLPVTE